MLFIILIIFGAGRLPEIGSALGKGIKEFRKGQSGQDEEGEVVVESKPSGRKGKGKA